MNQNSFIYTRMFLIYVVSFSFLLRKCLILILKFKIIVLLFCTGKFFLLVIHVRLFVYI